MMKMYTVLFCSFQFVLEIDCLGDCLTAKSHKKYIANFILIKSSNLIHLDSFAIVRISVLYSAQPLTVTVAEQNYIYNLNKCKTLMKRRLMINKMLVFSRSLCIVIEPNK